MAAGARAPLGLMARPPWRLLSLALAALSLLSLPVSAGSSPGPREQLVAAAPRWGWRNVSCPACRLLFGALDLALQVGTGGIGGYRDTGGTGAAPEHRRGTGMGGHPTPGRGERRRQG